MSGADKSALPWHQKYNINGMLMLIFGCKKITLFVPPPPNSNNVNICHTVYVAPYLLQVYIPECLLPINLTMPVLQIKIQPVRKRG